MEKYRRWTDEATGINPFIKAKDTTVKFSTILKSSAITVIKLHVIIFLIIPIILSLLFQRIYEKIPLIRDIYKFPIKLLCILLGLYNVDDWNIKKWLQKNKKNKNIILSNNITILDTFYYISIINSLKFVIISAEQDQFQSIEPLSAIVSILTKRQPFFKQTPSTNSLSFNNLMKQQLNNGNNCVIFYQGIRTNGLGTIKISTKLSKELYKLEKDYCVVHLKYTSAPQNLFSTVNSPLFLFLIALGSLTTSLKVRSSVITMNSYHSDTDIEKDINTFLIANAAKLLSTNPSSYFAFLDFYNKTQSSQYNPTSVEDTDKKQ